MIDSNSVNFGRINMGIVLRNYIRKEVKNKECKLLHTPREDVIADIVTIVKYFQLTVCNAKRMATSII